MGMAALRTRNYTSETELRGKVSHLYFSSDTFSAGCLQANDGPLFDRDIKFSIKSKVNLDEEIILHGKWVQHVKYGWQFQADSVTYPMPDTTSAEGLAEYLANSPFFKGIGPAKAKLIADHFGENFDFAVRNELEQVASVGKLSPESAEILQREWIARADSNAISTWLASFGLTHNQIKRIADRYGNRARQVLTDNPYILAEELHGIGFARADEIALKMGISKEHPGRIRACLKHLVLQESEEGGHTWVERKLLVKNAISKLALDTLQAEQLVRDQLAKLSTVGEFGEPAQLTLIKHNNNNSNNMLVALSWLHRRENDILEWLVNSRDSAPTSLGDSTILIDSAAKQTGALPSPKQREAVEMVLNSRISVLSGGAGTGKTYIIKLIHRIYSDANRRVAMCAPTGKAAKRMAQVVGDDAQTIHRLLEYNPATGNFKYNSEYQLPYDLIIVDEVSMCDINLIHSLMQAIDFNETQLLFVGDHNQLPPIGAGNVLRDILDRNLVPHTILTHCFRSAGELKRNSNSLLNGIIKPSTAPIGDSGYREWHVIDDREDPESLLHVLKLLVERYLPSWGFDPMEDCQIITPYNKGKLGVNRLNLELQRLWQHLKYDVELPEVTESNWDKRPRMLVGDKVMQIRNNYKLDNGHGVMNGTMGIITDIIERDKDRYYIVNFDDRDHSVEIEVGSDEEKEIVLAYACTIHKVQGSEWPCVVSVIHKAHTYMLSRNLIYTAATRARKTAILVGDRLGMRRAIRTTTPMERRTWLGIANAGYAN